MVVLPGIVGDLDFNSGVLSLKFARVVLDRIEGVVPHCEFKRQVGGKGLTENRAICQRASDKEFPEFHFMPPYVMWTEAALAVTFVKKAVSEVEYRNRTHVFAITYANPE